MEDGALGMSRRCRSCLTVNKPRKRKCEACGKALPKRWRPAHLKALELSYEQFVVLNGGENCGICGKPPGVKRNHRDHDHRSGKPRGILCFRCNAALRNYVTEEWLEAALAYVRRAA